MAASLNARNVGFAIGGMLGLFHLGWGILIALGFAQPLLDMVFRLHMLTPVYTVASFDLMLMIGLVVFTSVAGFCFGFVGATIWNVVAGKR
ncbi:MAG: hypothetical protein WC787_04690 [Patescibacteria group bacterium]|jgi:hypothetical protein